MPPPPQINAKTESHLPFVGYTRGICLGFPTRRSGLLVPLTVDRLCRDEHPDIRAERYHRVDLTAASTRSSVAASTPTGTLTVAPAIVTSIRSA